MSDTEVIPNLTAVRGGFIVKDAADGEHRIDVMQMMYGWRLCLVPKPEEGLDARTIDAAWCYFGAGTDEDGYQRNMGQAFLNAVLAAQAWDGYGEPTGFNKVAGA